jgi:heavy metal translocating P-type ATPase
MTCELCQAGVQKPVTEFFNGEEKVFCCEGCRQVYRLASEEGLLPLVLAPVEKKSVARSIAEATSTSAETTYLSVEGMWCPSCALVLERVWGRSQGVISAGVNHATGGARVRYLRELTSEEQIVAQARKLGYRAELKSQRRERERDLQAEDLLLRLIGAAAFSMWVMWISVLKLYPAYASAQEGTVEILRLQYLSWALTTPVMFYSGMPFIRSALRSLRSGMANMDTLVTLGTLTAYLYSAVVAVSGKGQVYFDSATMIVTIILLGRFLESRARGRALRTTRGLLKLQERYANVLLDDEVKRIPVEELKENALILVKAGEGFAADGLIEEGRSSVNEAMLTGESVPVGKGNGDKVMAGTVNLEGILLVRVTDSGDDTVLGRIIRAVEEAQDRKPPVQRLADRMAGVFTPIILLLSVVTAASCGILGLGWENALVHGVAVLVVACPCALGIATPLAVTVAVGTAASRGILIRTPEVLETIGRLDRIVFDKTGTLTKGTMTVRSVRGIQASQEEVLSKAAALEVFSEHPVARAVVQESEARKLTLPKVRGVEISVGRGVTGILDKDGMSWEILVGGNRLMEEAGIDLGEAMKLMNQQHLDGEMAALVAWEGRVRGIITLKDEVRGEACRVVNKIKRTGLAVSVISGDSRAATESIARTLCIEHALPQVMPEKKALAIAVLQSEGERVAMVGDGVNDAPALAQADLGIAVSGGTDVAIETSQIALLRPNLLLVTDVVKLSRKALHIIRENLAWAFVYNLIAVPAAVAGFLSPILAAVAMATSSLIVVGNSLRLTRIGD